MRIRAPAGGSTEEGATGAALAPDHEVATAGFGLASPVPRLPAAGRLRRGERRAQRPPVPQLQPLQVPHLGVPGRLVLEADAGRGWSPRPLRPPAARLPAGRVAQAPAVPRGDARPPAGLPAMGTDRRTQASCRDCPATLGKQGGRGKTQCKRWGKEESPPGAPWLRTALLPSSPTLESGEAAAPPCYHGSTSSIAPSLPRGVWLIIPGTPHRT